MNIRKYRKDLVYALPNILLTYKSPLIHLIQILFQFIVTGHANFQMEQTALTVGGFTQPSVARNIIEQNTGAERGFSQRFLWLFPKPTFAKFATCA